MDFFIMVWSEFFSMYRIVDEECYPYESGSSGAKVSCTIPRKIKSLLEINQCRSSNLLSGRTELYRSQPAYRISSRENDIKYEIMTYGPVQGNEHIFLLISYERKKCSTYFCTKSGMKSKLLHSIYYHAIFNEQSSLLIQDHEIIMIYFFVEKNHKHSH